MIILLEVVLSASIFTLGVLLYRRSKPDRALYMESRPDLFHRLLPHAYNVDQDALIQAIGGIRGLFSIYSACGAIATLVARNARADGSGNQLAEEAFVYAMCARFLTLFAIGEAVLRHTLPVWPPVFTTSLAKVYVDMACTLEAMEIHA